MEENNIRPEEIKNEENQINNENISEKMNENENLLNHNLNDLEPTKEQPKEKKKSKGFTRILRSIIKKNNEIMKNILKTRFTEWRKEALKGLKVKKTILIRISVSKEKDYKNRNMKLDDVKEKEKSKSINKYDIKSFKSPKDKNTYNIVREKIDNQDSVNNNNIKIVNTVFKNSNGNNNNVIEKKNDVNIKSEVDKNKEIKKEINNTNLKPQKTKLINISDEKPKYTPQATRNVRNQIIDSKNNLNNKFIKIDNTLQKNKTYAQNIQNSREKVDSNKKQPLNMNNIGMVYSSSTTKKNKKEKEQKYNYMNNVNLIDNKTLFNDKNQMKGYYTKNNGYHNQTFDISKSVNLNDKGYISQTTYKKIDNRKNINDMNRTKDIRSNINLYSRKTYQVNKNKNTSANNNNSSYTNYNSRSHNISSVDKVINPEKLKAGVTTVIQHYEGKIMQLQNYESNSFLNQKDKK